MAIFTVTEKQEVLVAYHVEADSEAMARDLVIAMGCGEFDEYVEVLSAEIFSVKTDEVNSAR